MVVVVLFVGKVDIVSCFVLFFVAEPAVLPRT